MGTFFLYVYDYFLYVNFKSYEKDIKTKICE